MNREKAIRILNILINERIKYFETVKYTPQVIELKDLKEYVERKLE